MFVASYRNTMAGAKRIVDDPGINLAKPRPRLEKLIQMSRKWQKAQRQEEARKERMRQREAEEKAQWRAIQIRERAKHLGARPAEIIDMVAFWHGITTDDLLGKSRVKTLASARHDAIAAVYLNCRMRDRIYTLPEVGRIFSRDHTTILHALRKRGVYVKRPPGYMRWIEA